MCTQCALILTETKRYVWEGGEGLTSIVDVLIQRDKSYDQCPLNGWLVVAGARHVERHCTNKGVFQFHVSKSYIVQPIGIQHWTWRHYRTPREYAAWVVF